MPGVEPRLGVRVAPSETLWGVCPQPSGMVWHVYTEDWEETRAAFLEFVEERRAMEAGETTPGHLSDEETDGDYDLITDGGE